MNLSEQTKLSLLFLARDILEQRSALAGGFPVLSEKIIEEAEKLERYVRGLEPKVVKGDLLVEGDVNATGNVTAHKPKGK